MNHEIRDILKLYKSILSEKKLVKEQADIFGIDELVYNPATKKKGEIGFGYDRGQKVVGITWKGHWNHLHIGFTNKDVAIDVINKADSLGLRTTENLIAKRDGNGYIDDVHDGSSFHYRLFPGEPQITAGVDISGNHSSIVELINYIISKYAKDNSYTYTNPGFLSMSYDELTKLVPVELKGKYKGRPIVDKDKALSPSIPGELPTISSDLTTTKSQQFNSNLTDRKFYEDLLKALGAPITPENMKFLLAWRQSEGHGGKYNPFNTTWELPGSTPMNSVGVQNYQSLEDGMSATLKTLLNGRYDCIVSGLKKDIGAAQIADCPSLETWGTGDLVAKVVDSYENGNPAKITPLDGNGEETEYLENGTQITKGENEIPMEKEVGDPILRMMAQSIFKENHRKTKKFLSDVDRIKNLLK